MMARARVVVTIVLAMGLLSAASPGLSAEAQQNSFAVKAGLFKPLADLKDYDAAFTGEVALGRRFHRYVAGELGFGYLRAGSEDNRLDAYPLTLSAKAILPLGAIEPYIVAGGGIYFARLKSPGVAEDHAAFGGAAGAGVQYAVKSTLGPAGFVGLEAKHVWFKPSFARRDVEARGVQTMAVFGFFF